MNPYSPARGDAGTPPLDWKRPALVFCAWLFGVAVLTGAASALRDGNALEAFGAVEYAPRILALEIARVRAPHIAALAAWATAVVLAHRSRRLDDEGGPGATERADADGSPTRVSTTSRAHLLWLFALVPFATIPAACVALCSGLAAMVLSFSTTPARFLAAVTSTLEWNDPLHGVARGALHAAFLGAAAFAAHPLLVRPTPRLLWKLVLAWLAAALLLGAVDVALDAVWTSPRPDMTLPQLPSDTTVR